MSIVPPLRGQNVQKFGSEVGPNNWSTRARPFGMGAWLTDINTPLPISVSMLNLIANQSNGTRKSIHRFSGKIGSLVFHLSPEVTRIDRAPVTPINGVINDKWNYFVPFPIQTAILKKTQFSNPLGVVLRIFVNPVCAQRTRKYDPIRC